MFMGSIAKIFSSPKPPPAPKVKDYEAERAKRERIIAQQRQQSASRRTAGNVALGEQEEGQNVGSIGTKIVSAFKKRKR